MDRLSPQPALPFRHHGERITPRDNPNYNVWFSDEKIKSVVERCLPDVKQEQMNIEHLPSLKSFNNRIYFINISAPFYNSRPQWTSAEPKRVPSSHLVLKIAGLPFGRNKIQNEVACLLLLEKHCPSIPCPKVIAWSEDGKKVRTSQFPRGFRENEVKNIPILALQAEDGNVVQEVRKDTEGQGWMLLTREEGKPINPEEDLSGKSGDQLMREIARHLATWRKDMPQTNAVGNLTIVGSGSQPGPAATLYDKAILPGYDVHIGGLITTSSSSSPLTSPEKYATHALKNSLRKLKDGKLYGQASDEVHDIVKRFLETSLPRLPIFRKPAEPMRFAHTDLSTRNVLVRHTNGVAELSSIIDYEFAGFYPKDEEFANCLQNDDLEWPIKKYAVFLSELKDLEALSEALAANIPAPSALRNLPDKALEFGNPDFHQAVLLLRLCINAAPWWIKDNGDHTKKELEDEFLSAKDRVEHAIALLEAMIPATPEKNDRRRSRTVSSTWSGSTAKN